MTEVYSLVAIKNGSISYFAQNTSKMAMLNELPSDLAKFENRVIAAIKEGPGHYGLGVSDSGDTVEMVIFEHSFTHDRYKSVVFLVALALLSWYTFKLMW